jgi:glycosyltransferase involved in cell wall biosynthesis
VEHYGDICETMRVLIISHYYPPSRSVGAKRTAALKKFLEDKGFFVNVLTANWHGEKDNNTFYLGKEIGVGKESRQNKIIQQKKKFRINLSLYVRSIDKTLFSNFSYNAVRFIYKNRDAKYDVIISSYKSSASVFLGVFASIIYKTPLIIEFRDLMSNFGRKKKVFLLDYIDRFIDKRITNFAKEVVVVSPTAKKYAQDFYRRDVNLVFNGIDKEELRRVSAEKNDNFITIFYSGTLSEHRMLDIICNHIERLRGEYNIILKVASAQNPIEYGGNPIFTEWLGLIPLHDVYINQSQSDFLLMLEGMGADSVENIPAKLYEYLGARKPIMAVCNPDSDIVSLLHETKSGSSVIDFYHFRDMLKKTWDLSDDDVEKYTRNFQNTQYLNIINSVIVRGY